MCRRPLPRPPAAVAARTPPAARAPTRRTRLHACSGGGRGVSWPALQRPRRLGLLAARDRRQRLNARLQLLVLHLVGARAIHRLLSLGYNVRSGITAASPRACRCCARGSRSASRALSGATSLTYTHAASCSGCPALNPVHPQPAHAACERGKELWCQWLGRVLARLLDDNGQWLALYALTTHTRGLPGHSTSCAVLSPRVVAAPQCSHT